MAKGKKRIKKPAFKRNNKPKSEKKPSFSNENLSSQNETVVWGFKSLDPNGPFGWKNLSGSDFYDKVLTRLKDFELMEWCRILGKRHHEVKLSSLSKEARKRLSDLDLDDIEQMVSFSFSSRERMWGIRSGRVYNILWWDPNHQVCPSNKKHT